jgi:hypothetical protein
MSGAQMRVLICGARDYSDPLKIKRQVRMLKREFGVDLLIISGGASGADTYARIACSLLGVAFCEFPAAWEFFGRSAGPLRNKWMLRWGSPNRIYVFHDNIEISRGTKDMVNQATKAGVEVRMFD